MAAAVALTTQIHHAGVHAVKARVNIATKTVIEKPKMLRMAAPVA